MTKFRVVRGTGQYRPRERVVELAIELLLGTVSAAPPADAGGTDL